MDHTYAEQEELAGRYVAGELPETQRSDFEAHMIECSQCLDGVEEAEGLRLGLLAVSAVDTLRMPLPLARAPLSPRFVLAMAAALACWLVPLVFLGVAGSRKDRELAAALSERDAALSALRAPRTPVASGDDARLRGENARLSAALDEARQPLLNLPVVLLSAVRSAEPVAPAHVTLDPSAAWVVLSLEVEAEAGRTCAVTIVDGAGRTVWKGGGLRVRDDALTVGLPSALLLPGRYRATASFEDGRRLAAYAFEIALR